MKNKTIIAIATGLAITGLAYIFRKKIMEFFSREEEDESFFDGRSTYSINELMPEDSNPFDKIREKLNSKY